jgi:hypothetical protein
MAYKLLGILTWKGAKWVLRRKYGAALSTKPLLAGGVVLALVGVGLALRQRGAIEA